MAGGSGPTNRPIVGPERRKMLNAADEPVDEQDVEPLPYQRDHGGRHERRWDAMPLKLKAILGGLVSILALIIQG